MLYLLVGSLIVYVALFTYALCKAAGDADRKMEEIINNDEDGDL